MRELPPLLTQQIFGPDNKVRRYLVNLEYWTLNLRLLLVYHKLLFPSNNIIKALSAESLSYLRFKGCRVGGQGRA